MADRDEFPKNVRQAVALRAGYICSFDGCSQLTVGPSDESELAVSRVGVAAHISAAAPGGKRYQPTLTREQRIHIDNAIWLCWTHSTLIDQDEASYPVERLRDMKLRHEARIAASVQSHSAPCLAGAFDLIALGPDTIGVGSVTGMHESCLELRLSHFVKGDLCTLVNFSDGFGSASSIDRFVLVNELGDGRQLAEPPAWHKSEFGIEVECNVLPRAKRTPVQSLPSGRKLGSDHDLVLENGQFVHIAGLDMFPQKLTTCLSFRRGEWSLDREFGNLLAEYFSFLRDSPWLNRLAKLEVIRLASIPFRSRVQQTAYLPLPCIERVLSFKFLEPYQDHDWLPVEVELDLNGLGIWTGQLAVFVPQNVSVPPSRIE